MSKEKIYTTNYDAMSRRSGKKYSAEILTQAALLAMEPGTTFCLASSFGVKYFKCLEPAKEEIKMWVDEAEEIE